MSDPAPRRRHAARSARSSSSTAIDASIALGDRIGLVGPNGAGKTTLLRLAAGRDEPDRGEVHRKRGLSLGLLAQEAHFDAAFMAAPDLRTAVRTGAAHLERDGRASWPRSSATAASASRPTPTSSTEFEVLGGYTLDQRVDDGAVRARLRAATSGPSRRRRCRAASRRGPRWPGSSSPTRTCCCSTSRPTTSTSTRSSGSRSTSAGATGSLLVASHDRAFLDATVTRVWELRDRRLTAFRGDYSAYHRQREERDARDGKDAETQAEQIARERELVQRYRSHRKFSQDARARGAARAARGRAARGAAGRAQAGAARPRRWSAADRRARGEIVGPARGPGRRLPARARRDRAGRLAGDEPRVVARVPFLAAQRGERIGIVGPNGAGKTTLLRTIAGDLPPLDGSLDASATRSSSATSPSSAARRSRARPSSTRCSTRSRSTAGEARGYLARFLFRGDDAFKEVRALSGGERSRLELALLGISRRTCCCSTSRRTTSTSRPARRSRRSWSSRRRRCSSSRTTGGCSRRSATSCGSSTTGPRSPFDGGYRAWRAAVADGWTVAGALAIEAARLGAGAAGPAVTRSTASLRRCA